MTGSSWSRALVLGAIWGFLEGTWLFVVPDVLLSYLAIGSLRRALVAALGVVLGAMAAAGVLYGLLSLDHAGAGIVIRRIWSALPGFRASMMDSASRYLESDGARGLVSGPASGIPYRVFVVEACRMRLPLSQILLWTPPARLERSLLSPTLVALARATVERAARVFAQTRPSYPSGRLLVVLVTIAWVGFYGWYWWIFVPRTYGAR